jgi:hypothetical protein
MRRILALAVIAMLVTACTSKDELKKLLKEQYTMFYRKETFQIPNM